MTSGFEFGKRDDLKPGPMCKQYKDLSASNIFTTIHREIQDGQQRCVL